jgi:hypothetical protein
MPEMNIKVNTRHRVFFGYAGFRAGRYVIVLTGKAIS